MGTTSGPSTSAGGFTQTYLHLPPPTLDTTRHVLGNPLRNSRQHLCDFLPGRSLHESYSDSSPLRITFPATMHHRCTQTLKRAESLALGSTPLSPRHHKPRFPTCMQPKPLETGSRLWSFQARRRQHQISPAVGHLLHAVQGG